MQLDFSPRVPFLEGSQLEWAKRDILSIKLEDRGEAADTFQIIHVVLTSIRQRWAQSLTLRSVISD